nr:hypothetical protein CFP56_54884 [Quercus suber]
MAAACQDMRGVNCMFRWLGQQPTQTQLCVVLEANCRWPDYLGRDRVSPSCDSSKYIHARNHGRAGPRPRYWWGMELAFRAAHMTKLSSNPLRYESNRQNAVTAMPKT